MGAAVGRKMDDVVNPSGKKRTFRVRMMVDVEVEIDQAVLDVVDDEWRSEFYDFSTPGDVAQHFAFNHLVNRVSSVRILDGFAHLANPDMVKFEIDREVEYEDTVETTRCPFTVTRGGQRMRCIREIHDGNSHTIETKKGEHKFVKA